MKPRSMRCAFPSCRAWAMHGQALCRAHRGRPGAAASVEGLLRFYDSVLTDDERDDILHHMPAPKSAIDVEVVMMRLLIRRVLEHNGSEQPSKALPLVRQAVDSICRALRTGQALEGAPFAQMASALEEALGLEHSAGKGTKDDPQNPKEGELHEVE